ncbi:MAG TPA: HAMP domain-containing sensor histidine kinase [Kofleriaceae bacterium]|jgi:signal transduction histidine kinase|nr:HAMP domain-containing sensor histidine kinase [Kofleriaceae bacterium]
MLAALDARDWTQVLAGVTAAATWLGSATPGDLRIPSVMAKLVALANHGKWEVRRAVAHVAAQTLHGDFEPVLARLATDDNSRVQQAAGAAALRRRDWANASALGRQHEDHLNATLDDIEVRFGPRGRAAVKRASEQIANTFARELYHEVIKLLSPLAASADRLRTRLADDRATRADLMDEAIRIERRATHLRAILDGMRSYTAQPKLSFAVENVKDIVDETVALVRDNQRAPRIEVEAGEAITAEVCRGRLVQALMNLLVNAVESYAGLETQRPIVVRVVQEDARVVISVQDSGCGMNEEVLADAPVLFATSKPHGTGFGLPLAIKIVESEHDGRLTLASTKGHGTVVKVMLPVRRQRDPT